MPWNDIAKTTTQDQNGNILRESGLLICSINNQTDLKFERSAVADFVFEVRLYGEMVLGSSATLEYVTTLKS